MSSFNADNVIAALKKLGDLHPVTSFDFGNEIEHANRLRERADGSFYHRDITADDIDAAATAADVARDYEDPR